MKNHVFYKKLILLLSALSASCSAGAGCACHPEVIPASVPQELNKTAHPPYLIEPPDILQVDLVAAVPKSPYRIRALDVLGFVVPNALPDSPISGAFTVEPSGTIYLGAAYGAVSVSGMTLEEARAASEKLLGGVIKNPLVSVSLIQTRAVQQIRGPHLVRADGTIGLGTYGSVWVAGKTISEAKLEIENALKPYFQDPEISLDVVGYNSKTYYVVFDGGGAGQQIIRLPITGSETVLDGVSQIYGLPAISDTRHVWVSRPRPDGCPPQVLDVNWKAVVEEGDARTNYQILPGDRIFVKAIPLVAIDIKLARLISPIERVLGVTLLGSSTVNSIRTNGQVNNGSSTP